MTQKKQGRQTLTYLFTVVLFVMVLAAMVIGLSALSDSAGQEGLTATQNAIEQAAVLCYATEGYYPPSLAYIEENYGIQIDRSKYAVRYDVFASNVMPSIRVVEW